MCVCLIVCVSASVRAWRALFLCFSPRPPPLHAPQLADSTTTTLLQESTRTTTDGPASPLFPRAREQSKKSSVCFCVFFAFVRITFLAFPTTPRGFLFLYCAKRRRLRENLEEQSSQQPARAACVFVCGCARQRERERERAGERRERATARERSGRFAFFCVLLLLLLPATITTTTRTTHWGL